MEEKNKKNDEINEESDFERLLTEACKVYEEEVLKKEYLLEDDEDDEEKSSEEKE